MRLRPDENAQAAPPQSAECVLVGATVSEVRDGRILAELGEQAFDHPPLVNPIRPEFDVPIEGDDLQSRRRAPASATTD